MKKTKKQYLPQVQRRNGVEEANGLMRRTERTTVQTPLTTIREVLKVLGMLQVSKKPKDTSNGVLKSFLPSIAEK